MKRAILYRSIPPADSPLLGEYHVGKGLNVTFKVYTNNSRLMLEIVGQGSTTLESDRR
jgi:hypothetical protein